jgi:hypothetical protein
MEGDLDILAVGRNLRFFSSDLTFEISKLSISF